MHAYIHPCMHACMHTYIHIYIYTHVGFTLGQWAHPKFPLVSPMAWPHGFLQPAQVLEAAARPSPSWGPSWPHWANLGRTLLAVWSWTLHASWRRMACAWWWWRWRWRSRPWWPCGFYEPMASMVDMVSGKMLHVFFRRCVKYVMLHCVRPTPHSSTFCRLRRYQKILQVDAGFLRLPLSLTVKLVQHWTCDTTFACCWCFIMIHSVYPLVI